MFLVEAMNFLMTASLSAAEGKGFSRIWVRRASETSWRAEATAALRMVTGKAGDCLDPTARNSNLLPVKAKGEVRLRSVKSRAMVGREATLTSRAVPPNLM